MTQKHYKMIAESINAHINSARRENLPCSGSRIAGFRELVSSFCVIFAEENPRFKPEVFVKACGF
jgi:hypothetical protein